MTAVMGAKPLTMDAALQHVLYLMQTEARGVQDDAEEDQAIKQIWHSASLSSEHLFQMTNALWAILLQVINAPTEWQFFDKFLNLIATLTGSSQISAQSFAEVVAALLELSLPFTHHHREISRLRALKIIGQLTASLIDSEQSVALEALSVESEFLERLLERLHDKSAKVRAAAVQVLQFLQGETQGGQQVSDALLNLLDQETSLGMSVVVRLQKVQDIVKMRILPPHLPMLQTVRLMVLKAVVINQATISRVLLRMRDTSVKVAQAAVDALLRISVQDLSLEQRLHILRVGLQDTRIDVRAAVVPVIDRWWRVGCAGDTLLMLGLLDVVGAHSLAEQALDLLVKSQTFNVQTYLQSCSRAHADLAHFVTAASGASSQSRQIWADSMGPQRAFLWRYSVNRAQAALKSGALRAAQASGESASLLSSSTTSYQDVVDTFLSSSPLQTVEVIRLLATGVSGCAFEAHQLLLIAMESMDWTDRPSSSAASTILESIIHYNLWRASDCISADAEAEAVADSQSGWEYDLMEYALEMHHDLAKVVLSILSDTVSCMTAHCGDGGTGVASTAVWHRCLGSLSVLMTAVASGSSTLDCKTAFTPAVNALIHPGLQHPTAEIRLAAWRCFGKLVLLPGWGSDLGSLWFVPKALECIRGAVDLRVQEAAASALLDAAQVYGTPCLDGLAASGSDLKQVQATSVTYQISHALLKLLQQPEGAAPTLESAYMNTLAQGLCRVLLSQSVLLKLQPVLGTSSSLLPPHAINELLPWLLVMIVHPRTETLSELRQTLASFLKVYLGQSALGVQQVCLALVPSLEIALSVDTTKGSVKGLSVQLIHLVVKLLPDFSGLGELLRVAGNTPDWQADSLQAIFSFMCFLLKPNKTVKVSVTKQKALVLELSKVLGYFSLHPGPRAGSVLRLARYCLSLSSNIVDLWEQLSSFLRKHSGADGHSLTGPLTDEEQMEIFKDLAAFQDQRSESMQNRAEFTPSHVPDKPST